MYNSDLENRLEAIRQRVSQEEFIDVLLDYLSQGPNNEERNVLEVWLQVHGHQNEKVIKYWKKILDSDDTRRQELAASSLLAKCLAGNTQACKILREFFGEEPSFEVLNAWRIRQLGLDKFLTNNDSE